MPSAQEIFDQLVAANTKLDQINGGIADVKTSVDAVRDAVEHVDATLSSGFSALITLGEYTNDALYQNDNQNETIICNLEKITRQTCQLLNEAHTQTQLQTSIEHGTTTLVDLFSTVHAEAALDLERREALRREIEECCPPEPQPPVCVYEPCEKPQRLKKPPKVKSPEEPKKPEEPK
jgi:hypothetical protein